jgi:hypothetical protein
VTKFSAIAGQSIYDVCLQTYGTLDNLFKLMQDNNILGLNQPVTSGQPFVWDETQVTNQQLNAVFAAAGINYCTDVSSLGSVFYVQNSPNAGNNAITPANPYTPPLTQAKTYEMTLNTYFISNADGTTVITLTDVNGNPLTGMSIVQLEKETKPLIYSTNAGITQYSWNPNTSQVTLQNGTTLDNGETLFALYTKIVTS